MHRTHLNMQTKKPSARVASTRRISPSSACCHGPLSLCHMFRVSCTRVLICFGLGCLKVRSLSGTLMILSLRSCRRIFRSLLLFLQEHRQRILEREGGCQALGLGRSSEDMRGHHFHALLHPQTLGQLCAGQQLASPLALHHMQTRATIISRRESGKAFTCMHTCS